jgi:hypothetical protein
MPELVPPALHKIHSAPGSQQFCEGRRVDGALHAFWGHSAAQALGSVAMCRNIRTLYNFEPPASHDEVHAAALQYVRKISGFTKPSQVNEAAFLLAVERVAAASAELLAGLETQAPPKDRETEAAKARARAAQRYAA